jgi:hypothetical protein
MAPGWWAKLGNGGGVRGEDFAVGPGSMRSPARSADRSAGDIGRSEPVPSRSRASMRASVVGRLTVKTCAHLLQRTFTPVWETRSSARRNFVLQCSHCTIIGEAEGA